MNTNELGLGSSGQNNFNGHVKCTRDPTLIGGDGTTAAVAAGSISIGLSIDTLGETRVGSAIN